MYTIKNLTSQTGHVATETKGIFTIVEHDVDYSVSPANAQTEYFMSHTWRSEERRGWICRPDSPGRSDAMDGRRCAGHHRAEGCGRFSR